MTFIGMTYVTSIPTTVLGMLVEPSQAWPMSLAFPQLLWEQTFLQSLSERYTLTNLAFGMCLWGQNVCLWVVTANYYIFHEVDRGQHIWTEDKYNGRLRWGYSQKEGNLKMKITPKKKHPKNENDPKKWRIPQKWGWLPKLKMISFFGWSYIQLWYICCFALFLCVICQLQALLHTCILNWLILFYSDYPDPSSFIICC